MRELKEEVVTLTAPTLENLTLNVAHDVHVQASLERDVRRAARDNGTGERNARRAAAADGD